MDHIHLTESHGSVCMFQFFNTVQKCLPSCTVAHFRTKEEEGKFRTLTVKAQALSVKLPYMKALGTLISPSPLIWGPESNSILKWILHHLGSFYLCKPLTSFFLSICDPSEQKIKTVTFNFSSLYFTSIINKTAAGAQRIQRGKKNKKQKTIYLETIPT